MNKIFRQKCVYHISYIIRHIGRLEILTIFFVVILLVLLFAAFRYTILDGQYYRDLANRQQTAKVTNTVSRGSIYTKNEPVGVLSTSADLPDLAIDPTASGSRSELVDFLVQVFRREACGIAFDIVCIEKSYELIKMPLPPDGERITPAQIDAKFRTYIESRLSQEYVVSSLIKENLSDEELDKFSAFISREAIGSGIYLIANNAYINPMEIVMSDEQKSELLKILGIPLVKTESLFAQRKIRYLRLLSQISFATKEFIDDHLSTLESGKNASQSIVLNSLILEPHPSRYYPQRFVGSQVTGFVDGGGVGRYGVEAYFDRELQGKSGVQSAKKDIQGRTIESYNLDTDRSINGADITLTIDRNVQKFVGDRLARAVRDFRANRASAVVMDPKTGAIIAMVSAPEFDPNEYSRVYDLEMVTPEGDRTDIDFDFLGMPLFVEDPASGESRVVNGRVVRLRLANNDERKNLLITKYKYRNNIGPLAYVNDPIGSLYEPGSVFKSLTVAIGIDSGEIRPTDTYYDAGSIKIDQFTISNLAKECIGNHTYTHALNWSCNVGMIDIVRKVGKGVFSEYVRDFGFGAKTNITMDGEVYSEIPNVDKWNTSTLYTSSFGQGIAATVLQMAAAYSTIANGGVYMQPYIVDSIMVANGQSQKIEPRQIRRVLREETTKKVTNMMVEGATIGYAKKGAVAGYRIAGKTGTSQIAGRGGYEKGPYGETIGRTITSYGGFAPADDPKFVLIVKVERPRTAQYSETTASVVFSDISKYLLEYYGVPKEK